MAFPGVGPWPGAGITGELRVAVLQLRWLSSQSSWHWGWGHDHHDGRRPVQDARTIWAEVDATLARIDAQFAAIDAKIAMGLSEEHGCPSPRDRAAAQRKLDELRREKAEIERRLAQLRADRTICRLRRTTRRPLVISAACLDNPLAKDCM